MIVEDFRRDTLVGSLEEQRKFLELRDKKNMEQWRYVDKFHERDFERIACVQAKYRKKLLRLITKLKKNRYVTNTIIELAEGSLTLLTKKHNYLDWVNPKARDGKSCEWNSICQMVNELLFPWCDFLKSLTGDKTTGAVKAGFSALIHDLSAGLDLYLPVMVAMEKAVNNFFQIGYAKFDLRQPVKSGEDEPATQNYREYKMDFGECDIEY